MNTYEAIRQLIEVLAKQGPDRYCLPCPKAVLLLKLLGSGKTIRYSARDHVAFRIDPEHLVVEDLATGAIRRNFPWDRVESAVAGEPESDNHELFQG